MGEAKLIPVDVGELVLAERGEGVEEAGGVTNEYVHLTHGRAAAVKNIIYQSRVCNESERDGKGKLRTR